MKDQPRISIRYTHTCNSERSYISTRVLGLVAYHGTRSVTKLAMCYVPFASLTYVATNVLFILVRGGFTSQAQRNHCRPCADYLRLDSHSGDLVQIAEYPAYITAHAVGNGFHILHKVDEPVDFAFAFFYLARTVLHPSREGWFDAIVRV